MSHLSFRGWPIGWNGQGKPRYAQCEYVTSVSLERCTDPYSKVNWERRYTKVKAAVIDMNTIERCVLWSLGIDPNEHTENGEAENDEA